MSNSNGIKAALKVMNRVYELRTAGLKLKESKSDLRVILCEMSNELPAEILFNVEQVLKRRSGRDFFNQLSTVIYCAEAALRVAEQMDEKHAEALAMDAIADGALYLVGKVVEIIKRDAPTLEVMGEMVGNTYVQVLTQLCECGVRLHPSMLENLVERACK